eukprot:10637081-Karenia_brevis.AAC.1
MSQHPYQTSYPIRPQTNQTHEVRPKSALVKHADIDCMPNDDEQVDEGLEEEMEDDDKGVVGEQIQRLPRLRGPVVPPEGEVEAHRLSGHAVYRTWCEHCVRGSGQNSPHRTRAETGQHDLPR